MQGTEWLTYAKKVLKASAHGIESVAPTTSSASLAFLVP